MKKLVYVWVTAAALSGSGWAAQSPDVKESFTAFAVASDNLGSGTATLSINLRRWSTEEERATLIELLKSKGPEAAFNKLQDMKPTGTISTPGSVGYDLRFAQQTPGENGGRRIVLMTDRPIGFAEAQAQPRSLEYPFTVIQMDIGPDGKGKGTMSYAARVTARGKLIQVENFSTAPIMLTQIEASRPK